MSINKSPAKSEIYFAWFNRYAGVTVKTPSKTLVLDPVDLKAREFKNVDAILVTHEHYDHLDPALVSDMCKQMQCQVIADPTSARKLRNTIPQERLKETSPGEEIKLGSVNIKTESSNHPPATTPVSFVITSEDGVKVFHTADSLPFPEMAQIGDREKLDVVFCTVGIAPGTSPETGVEIAKFTHPKVAVPYHASSSTEQKRFAELLKTELPRTTCLVPEVGKIYQVSKRS